MAREYRYIRFFNEIGIEDVPLVGGKNASLGEMSFSQRSIRALSFARPRGHSRSTKMRAPSAASGMS